MNESVTAMAKQTGLTYHFDKAVVANSFDAHRFSHLAKHHHLQNEAEEALFASYFTNGKNTADPDTLIELGKEIGLDADVLTSNLYSEDVNADIDEASRIGVTGVPFLSLIENMPFREHRIVVLFWRY